MATTVIRVEDVSKRFIVHKEKSLKERIVNAGRSKQHREDFWALRDVDFEIESGSTVGLIGKNGSGKSTLLKLIGGIMQPTTGAVTRRGRLAALIELGAGFHPDLTGRENVYLNCAILGLSKAQTRRHFDSIVEFSGIESFIDTQVKFYSSGMYVRLAFAVAVHIDPDILLVDEVLAVGDEPFQRKCMNHIRRFQSEGRTIVLVTHSLDQVADLCDRAIVLDHGIVQADDVPRKALQVLRAEFDSIREAEQERERTRIAPADEADNPAEPEQVARVVAVEVLDTDGQPMSHTVPGADIVLRITVESERELTGWMLGSGIDTSLGQNVVGTNTKLIGMTMPPLLGRAQFEMRYPNVWLGEGQYMVHGAIADLSGFEYDRVRDVASFTVEADGSMVGFVFSRAEVRTV